MVVARLPEEPKPNSPALTEDREGKNPEEEDFFEVVETPSKGIAEGEEVLTPPKVIVRFFLIPLGLVVAILGIYLLFGLMFGGEKSPEDLVHDLRSAYPSTREHALYDLAYYLQRHPEAQKNPLLLEALLDAFRHRESYRPEVRVYLAMALGYLGHPDALPVLKEGLNDPDVNMVFYTIWALGKIGDARAAPWIRPFLKSEDSGLREIAVIVLGELRDRTSIPEILPLLEDPVTSVRVNTIFTLARFGRPEALPGLKQLARRDSLRAMGITDNRKIEDILLNVIQLSRQYPGDVELQTLIADLKDDPSLKVRDAVLKLKKK